MMTVDAYMVEDTNGETHIVESGDLSTPYWSPDGKGGRERRARWDDVGEWVTVLASLNLYRSIDHGARTADGTALEVIAEVCEGIVAPVLEWMCGAFGHYAEAWERCDYLAALNSVRGEFGWEAGRDFEPWNGSGWTPDSWAEDEPIHGQGCEQDMCEDTWTDCGGVVWSDGDCGMTWLYVTVEDYTR